MYTMTFPLFRCSLSNISSWSCISTWSKSGSLHEDAFESLRNNNGGNRIKMLAQEFDLKIWFLFLL